MIPILYRTMKLRAMEADLPTGMEGYYRERKEDGWTRKQIARELKLSVPALEKWITKWNKAKGIVDGRGRG